MFANSEISLLMLITGFISIMITDSLFSPPLTCTAKISRTLFYNYALVASYVAV